MRKRSNLRALPCGETANTHQGRHVGSLLPVPPVSRPCSWCMSSLVVSSYSCSSHLCSYQQFTMSASPVARSITQSQSIPSKRMLINDPSQLPMDYSTTPGGTLYSTTPGGTRIVYERSTLMFLRNSPLSKTPPNIPDMPDSMSKGDCKHFQPNGLRTSPLKKSQFSEDRGEQFEIDI